MRRFFKSRIFVAIVTASICITGTAYATTQILAKDVSYAPKDTSWNVDNVKDALDDLYNKSATCKEWSEISGATIANAWYIYDNAISLYKCGNICKISFQMEGVNVNTEYQLITNSKYYPKEQIDFSGIGMYNGYASFTLYKNGKIKVTNQGIENTGWASADNIAFICGN